MTRCSGIYKIVSIYFPNRVYIGSAVNLSRRIRDHKSCLKVNKHANKKLQHHYNKYGQDDLIFSVIEFTSKEKLIEKEQYYIDLYSPYFNLCPHAGNSLGCHWTISEEGRLNMKQAKKGYKPSRKATEKAAEVVHNRQSPLKGRKRPEEFMKKLHEFRIGCKHSLETKQKMRLAKLGKKSSDETKLKISLAGKGNQRAEGKHWSFSEEKKKEILRKKYGILNKMVGLLN